MNINQHILTAAVSLTIAATLQAAAPEYTIVDLGTLGGFSSESYGINNLGQVVGVADTTSGYEHAVLFGSVGGVNQDLGTLPGAVRSRALAINDLGQIVGNSEVYTPSNSSTVVLATLFSGTGTNNTYLGNLNGNDPAFSSSASAINNSGQIIGSAKTGVYNNGFGDKDIVHPVYFSNTGNIDLDPTAANGGTIPHAILLNPVTPVSTQTGNTQETKFVSGMSYTKFTSQVSADGFGTTVNFLDGVANANRVVTTTTDGAAHDGFVSDVATVTGTFNDIVGLCGWVLRKRKASV